jgi:hypothetical protein
MFYAAMVCLAHGINVLKENKPTENKSKQHLLSSGDNRYSIGENGKVMENSTDHRRWERPSYILFAA